LSHDFLIFSFLFLGERIFGFESGKELKFSNKEMIFDLLYNGGVGFNDVRFRFLESSEFLLCSKFSQGSLEDLNERRFDFGRNRLKNEIGVLLVEFRKNLFVLGEPRFQSL